LAFEFEERLRRQWFDADPAEARLLAGAVEVLHDVVGRYTGRRRPTEAELAAAGGR
jgi:hypothetical protein